MKKRILLNVLLASVLLIMTMSLVGCRGIGETSAERADDLKQQKRINQQMLTDDVDMILQQDRASRLSEHTIR